MHSLVSPQIAEQVTPWHPFCGLLFRGWCGIFLLALLPAEAASLTAPVNKAAPRFTFAVMGTEAGSWPAILSSIGLVPGAPDTAGVAVIPSGFNTSGIDWAARVERGTILILEGGSPVAEQFGFKQSSEPGVAVQNIQDLRAPELRMIWEQAVEVPLVTLPENAKVFARERRQQIPLLAGIRRGAGAVLWVAVAPGIHGYERFPYIPQALMDLGLDAPFRSGRLWAFFDSAYRSRADLDFLARRWREAGIGAIHVAAWHNWERDKTNDDYLHALIDACHKNAIQVYAWLELPHVSEKFWDGHPEWREKTALLQDARLDWRKLVNLTNRAAFAAAAEGAHDLIMRFDWDGVNLAELYFESLEGVDNPARFTPMNDDVRGEFKALRETGAGFDPIELFTPASPRHWSKNAAGLKRFLEFRAQLAQREQSDWIAEIEAIRMMKPHLDLALTHIDDRFDESMRDKLGADTSRVLPLLKEHDFTFLIEDPATIWNLGPQRYPQIAARYAAVTPAQEKLAVDINIVERYQDVYPTKQQTGSELFQLVHTAAAAFPRVALYFENSILTQDLPLLASAAAAIDHAETDANKLTVQSRSDVGVPWSGAALVDGKPWPFTNTKTVWLPKGTHSVEPVAAAPAMRVLDFNGELKSASVNGTGVNFAYQSSARALAILEKNPSKLEIDGMAVTPEMVGPALLLPKGQHLVSLE